MKMLLVWCAYSSHPELERQAKRKELQDKILSERQKEVEKALVEEREMQQMLLAIDREKYGAPYPTLAIPARMTCTTDLSFTPHGCMYCVGEQDAGEEPPVARHAPGRGAQGPRGVRGRRGGGGGQAHRAGNIMRLMHSALGDDSDAGR